MVVMGLLDNAQYKRRVCDHEWTESERTVECQRWAVVSVDGAAYCAKHAGSETDVSDR